jgi:hypothetical protein
LEFCNDFQPDYFIFGGDQLHMDTISKYNTKKPLLLEGQRLKNEYQGFQQDVLDPLEHILSDSVEKYMLVGNHEWRIDRLIEGNPQWQGFVELDVNLRLDDWTLIPFNEVLTLGNMNFIHGVYTNKYSSFKTVSEYDANIFYGHCFDDKTELLTYNGFKKYTDLNIGDYVLTLNQKTRFLEWNKVNHVFIYNHYGEMIRIKNRSVDLLVDDEHGLLATWKKGDNLQLFPAKDIFDKSSIAFLVSGKFEQDNVDYPISDDLLRLVAWIISEGSIFYADRNPKYVNVEIAQSDKENISQIKSILERLHIDFSLKERKGCKNATITPYRFRIRAKDSRLLHKLIPNKHDIPSWLWKLSDRQFHVFLDEYIKGDGTEYPDKNVSLIYSVDIPIIDYFQIMLFTHGYSSKVYWRNGTFHSDRKSGQLAFINKELTWIDGDTHCKRVPYSGEKWCVNVDNGTLVVRRNNKITITQNTHTNQTYTHHTRVNNNPKQGVNVGCACDINPAYNNNKPNRWLHQFLFFYLLDNGDFSYYTPIIVDGMCVINDKLYGGK